MLEHRVSRFCRLTLVVLLVDLGIGLEDATFKKSSSNSNIGTLFSKPRLLLNISRRATDPRPWNPPLQLIMADVAEVATAFSDQGFAFGDDDDVAQQCLAMCRQFNASAFDLALSWDAYYTTNAGKMKTSTPDAAHMEAFRAHYERHVVKSQKVNALKTPKTYVYGKRSLAESLESGALDVEMADAAVDAQLAAVTPGRNGDTPGAKTANAREAHLRANCVGVTLPAVDPSAALNAMAPTPGTTTFSKRPTPGATKTELNAQLPGPTAGSGFRTNKNAPCVEVSVDHSNQLTSSQRFMRDRVADKVDMIESRLNAFASEIEAKHPGLNCRGAVYAASQDDVTVVGRVVCDSEGKLNEQSVQLEGSIATSNGMRVRLELRDLPSFSLFPGQIVCVQGQNPSGHCLVAKRLISSSAPEMAKSIKTAPAHSALTCAIASGPFTCMTDLAYEPLDALFAKMKDSKPDAIVLLGPFVDCENKIVAGDDASVDPLEQSFEQVFAVGVRDRLEAFLANADVDGYKPAVVLVPSVRDATAPATFPQPPLVAEGAIECPSGSTVTCTSNPGTFTVNGIVFATCTQDVLRHLSASETARDSASNDRMARLAQHLPGQRSAYPLFPPAKTACLDASLSEHLTMKATPDVLVLPSDLNPFAKVVPRVSPCAAAATAPAMPTEKDAAEKNEDDSFVAINPGRLAKGNAGGAFALVRIAEGTPEGQGEQLHSVGKRARVDIVKV